MEPTRERTERVSVAVVAADLPADREDVLVGAHARVQHEALHRVEIDLEARRSALRGVVEALRAHDRDAHRLDAYAALLEAAEIRSHRAEERVVGVERLAVRREALLDVVVLFRARLAERPFGVERQAGDELARRRTLLSDGRRAEHARPRFAERGFLVGYKFLRVVDSRGESASRATQRDLCGRLVGGRHRDGRDDERPEPRAEAIFVHADDDHAHTP